jgi:hypothetical protein
VIEIKVIEINKAGWKAGWTVMDGGEDALLSSSHLRGDL